MKEITAKTWQSIHLSIYTAGKLLVIAQIDSGSSYNYHVEIGSSFDLLETSAAALADVIKDINQCFRSRFNRQQGKGISKRFSRNFGVNSTEGVSQRNKHFRSLLSRFKKKGLRNIFKVSLNP